MSKSMEDTGNPGPAVERGWILGPGHVPLNVRRGLLSHPPLCARLCPFHGILTSTSVKFSLGSSPFCREGSGSSEKASPCTQQGRMQNKPEFGPSSNSTFLLLTLSYYRPSAVGAVARSGLAINTGMNEVRKERIHRPGTSHAPQPSQPALFQPFRLPPTPSPLSNWEVTEPSLPLP